MLAKAAKTATNDVHKPLRVPHLAGVAMILGLLHLLQLHVVRASVSVDPASKVICTIRSDDPREEPQVVRIDSQNRRLFNRIPKGKEWWNGQMIQGWSRVASYSHFR